MKLICCLAFGLAFPVLAAQASAAAPCSNTGGQYEAWKPVMAQEARAQGVGKGGISALMGTSYSTRTIGADRNQKSFKYSLPKFMEVRGADAIVSQGRARKAKSPDFYAALERSYGVPAGVLLAIHGMETGFGNFMGDTNVISAIATLAYDCRRSDFFTPHLIAALVLVDRGTLTPASVGAKHGEVGHTQFLPGNVLAYGVDGNGDGKIDLTNLTDAMASTANFLARQGLAPRRGLSGGRAELCRDQAMECGQCLSAGDRDHGRPDRPLTAHPVCSAPLRRAFGPAAQPDVGPCELRVARDRTGQPPPHDMIEIIARDFARAGPARPDVGLPDHMALGQVAVGDHACAGEPIDGFFRRRPALRVVQRRMDLGAAVDQQAAVRRGPSS